MKELTPIFRTFELESSREYTDFTKHLQNNGYVLEKKYNQDFPPSYSIKKPDAKDTEGSLYCPSDEQILRVIRDSELEKLADDFMALNLAKDSAETKARMQEFEHAVDVRDIAGVEETGGLQ